MLWIDKPAASIAYDANGIVIGAINLDGTVTSLGGGASGTPRTITASGNAVLADNNGLLAANSASAITLTIPNDSTVAWPIGAFIPLYQAGAGVASFAAGAGVTLNSPTGNAASVQFATTGAQKVAANTWSLV